MPSERPDRATNSAADRRVFHSKVDSIRPTYGFEDVSLAPGTSTIEPDDVDLAIELCGIQLAIPILASAMDAVVDPRFAGRAGPARRTRGPQPRGRPDALRRPRRGPRPDRRGAGRRGPRPPGRGLRAAHPRRPRSRAGSRRSMRPGRRAAVAVDAGGGPAVRTVLRRARRGPLPRPVAGQQRPPPRDRLRPAVARRLHPLHADPGRRRQHDERRGGLRADGAGRGRGLRRRRSGRGLHDPRGARHRRPAGHRDQRRGRGPRRVLHARPVATSRSSPTAGCAAAASSPRRSPRARTR